MFVGMGGGVGAFECFGGRCRGAATLASDRSRPRSSVGAQGMGSRIGRKVSHKDTKAGRKAQRH